MFKGKRAISTFGSVWVPVSVAVLAALILLLLGMTWIMSGEGSGYIIFQVFMLALLAILLMLTLVALKEHRDTTNLFKTSFHINPGLCAITVPETGKHLDVNQAWLNVLGYERHEVLGKTAVELRIWGKGSNSREAVLALLKRDGRIDGYEAQIRAKDGSPVEVILRVEQVKVGRQNRLFFIAQDITKRKQAEQIQRDQQAQLNALSEVPFDAIFTSENGICTGQNITAAELFGYTLEEALGQPVTNWVAPESRALITENIVTGNEKAYEAVGLRKDGSTFAIEIHGKTTQYNGRTVRVTALRDISDRKRADAQLRLLSTVVEQSPVAVMVTDTEGDIEYVNSGFERSSGYSSGEVIGQSAAVMKSGLVAKDVYKQLWETIKAGESWSGELQNRKKDGTVFWEQMNISPVEEPDGEVKHYLAIKEDITLRKEQDEQILMQAHYDGVTGLPNRFLALDRLSQAIKVAQREQGVIAVLFVDLDDFKKVNDSFGHDIGDQALVESAQRLQRSIRAEDTVGRLGGDEFLAILGGIRALTDIEPVVDSILEAFQAPFVVAKREVVITVSVGIALYPDDGETARNLLRSADTAMYHSKSMGRNTYNFFTDEMNAGVARRLEIETELRGALEREELFLNYQPIMDLGNQSVVGAEVLIRWNNPKLGMVSPVEFIAIAERTGLIIEIGEFVLRRSLQEAACWVTAEGFKLAVNISPRQFRDKKLISTITSICGEHGLPLSCLEFEITEGVLMCGESTASSVLGDLRAAGAGISMDDFGTGYSSLSYLRRYPFDTLKIDRSFVADVTTDSEDRMLISATISMAKSLGLKVIAEGIEIEEQLEFLMAEGCDLGQGYYFSKPVSAEAFGALLVCKLPERSVESEAPVT